MSESALIVLGNTTVLPGYTISPLRLPQYYELQRYFEIHYLAIRALATTHLTERLANQLMLFADDQIASGTMRYGKEGFDASMHDRAHLPFLLYQCLREKHDGMTEAKARLLITDKNLGAVWRACMESAGYNFTATIEPKNVAGAEKPSTSPPSIDSSGTEAAPALRPLNDSPGLKQ